MVNFSRVYQPVPPGLPVRLFAATGGDVGGRVTVTDMASHSCVPAVVAKSNVVTGWSINNPSATPVTIVLQDGPGGAVLHGPIQVPAGGANNMPLIANPEAFAGTVDTAVYVEASAVTSGVSVQLYGYSK